MANNRRRDFNVDSQPGQLATQQLSQMLQQARQQQYQQPTINVEPQSTGRAQHRYQYTSK